MKSIILISVLACSLSLSAQTNKEKFVPMIKKTIGVSFQSFDGLNSRISGFPQYESLKDHMFTISLGSMHVINNFVSQFTATAGSSLTGHSDRKSSAIRSLSAAFDIGYDVIPADKIMLYPLVGIGAETYHAIFYKDNSAVPFDDVLESPAVQNNIRSVKFTNAFITYRVGLGFAVKSPKGHGTVGIQAGYSGGFKDRAWRSSENQALAGAPVDNLSRFSVSLVLTGSKMMMR
jgi:hypothetical protein